MLTILLAAFGFVVGVVGVRREIKHPCVRYQDLMVYRPPMTRTMLLPGTAASTIYEPGGASLERTCVERKGKTSLGSYWEGELK